MEDPLDAKLGQLLREGAPPARDPFFRITVIERRARQRYEEGRRRIHVAAAIVASLTLATYLVAPSKLLPVSLILLFGAGFIVASLFTVRGLRQAWGFLRGSRR